jgi:hypothetical protein
VEQDDRGVAGEEGVLERIVQPVPVPIRRPRAETDEEAREDEGGAGLSEWGSGHLSEEPR